MKKVFFLAVAFLLLPLGLALADGNAAGADAPPTGQATALPAIASFAANYGAGVYAMGFSGGSPVSSFSYGLSMDVTLPFLLPKSEWFALSAKAAYWYFPSLALAGIGATFYITPWFSLTTDGLAGYFYWQLSNTSSGTALSGFAWTLGAEADFTLQLGSVTPYLGLRATWYNIAGPRGVNVYAVVGDHMALGSGPTTDEGRQRAASALPQALVESAANEISLGEEVSYWSVAFSPAFGMSLFNLYDTSKNTLPPYRTNLHTAVTFNMPFWPTAFVISEFGQRSILDSDNNWFMGLELGLAWRLLPRLELSVRAGPIYNQVAGKPGTYSWTSSIGGLAGIGLSFYLAPTLSLGADVSFDFDQTRYGELNAGLGLTFHFLEKGKKAPTQPQQAPGTEKPQPLQAAPATVAGAASAGLVISDLAFDGVFPIFHTYYDNHRIGKMTVRNSSDSQISNLTVSLQIRQYMDVPKECASIPSLNPGEKKEIDLYALFKSNILEITEKTKLGVEISATYSFNGRPATLSKSETIRVFDRNAMTWDDNRKAAAFVTAKDPAVLMFSNNLNAVVKPKMNRALDKNLQTAIALHDALRLYGLSYVSNPLTSYADVSKDKTAVDTLKFPRETFSYHSGDCSDLSILYCALMESLQIETAFITIPGHIFMAFALKVTPEEARASFSHADDLIFLNNKVWVPVEITERDKTFLDAWQEGAKEYRENLSRKQADFYPVREAWNTYEAVGLPGSVSPPTLPEAKTIIQDFQNDTSRYVKQEIFTRVATLQAEITRTKESPKSLNALGVLYGRYDLEVEAETLFQKAVSKEEYAPALVNLGNLSYLRADMNSALAYFTRAYKRLPQNPRVLLGLARTNQELENYGTVKQIYGELKKISPDLAQQFAYLELKGEESTRAAELSQVKDLIVWDE